VPHTTWSDYMYEYGTKQIGRIENQQ